MPLTSVSCIGSRTYRPETIEAADISSTLALSASVRVIGAERLMHARMDWDRLFSSANPPGALTPTVARETLTRQAIRRKENRRKARRSGNASFVKAYLRSAA